MVENHPGWKMLSSSIIKTGPVMAKFCEAGL